MHLSHPKYRPDIDGLRALAILSVVAFHAFPEWVKGGFIGVDIFFVISGFLISTIVFENLDRGTFSFTEFYARRIKRIFPALVVVMASCYVFGWFALLAYEYQQLGKHIAGGAGFISNFLLWKEAGYFDSSADTKPLLHLWSLGIEEQFYIVFPLLMWFAWKRNLNLFMITAGIALASFCFNLIGIKKDAVAAFYMPYTRFWELLCGSLLAWVTLYKSNSISIITTKINNQIGAALLCQAPKADDKLFVNTLSLVGLLLLLYGFWRINKGFSFPGKWAVIPVLGAVFVILAGPKAWANRHLLSNKAVVWFGLISFPLYLWHWPLLSFARVIENGPVNYEIRIAAVLLSIALSWFTYRFVERPIRFAGGQDKIKIASLSVLIFIIGSIGYLTYKNDGLSYRIDGPKKMLNELISTPYPKVEYFECQALLPELKDIKFDDCKISKIDLPTILFIGDSHTKHFGSTDWGKFGDNSILMVTKSECLPFSNDQFLNKNDCKKAFEGVINYASSSKSVKTVILSGYWAYLMSGGFEKRGDNWRIAERPDAEDALTFKKNFRFFASKLLDSGKNVIFLMDIPDLDFDIKTCFDNRPFRITVANTRNDCWINEADYFRRMAPFDLVLDEVFAEYPSIKVYNPRRIFCNGAKCVASDGLMPYYANGDHLNHYGAGLVVDGLLNNFPSLLISQ